MKIVIAGRLLRKSGICTATVRKKPLYSLASLWLRYLQSKFR